ARNSVMIISGLENFIYLLLAVILLLRLLQSPRRFFSLLFTQPFLLFLLSYSLIFSVLVGLSTSNFGALVRFKIPFLASFVAFLVLMQYFLKKENRNYLNALLMKSKRQD
ncbi:MAG TPA: hypothetical protein VL651_03825, partial [Bacteroidia bacterium]|nr:hypothetical protein [Bacteroidia bacterium]